MTVQPTAVLLALQLGVLPAFAQGDGGFQRWPTRERQAAPAPAPQGQQGARAREREGAPAPAPQGQGGSRVRERDTPSRPAEPAARPPAATQPAPRRERENETAQRDGQSRNRDRDGAGPRVAVPRQGPPPRVAERRVRPAPNVYIVRPPAYRYTPRFSRPYVYGSLGPGYFYYGSFGWYPRATYYSDRGYFGRGYGYDTGDVRLRVEPRWAEVYVDGFYAGTVDDFDGTFQSLRLESGPYHIEIVAPGYETLEVDVRVSAGQKITYRGELRREF